MQAKGDVKSSKFYGKATCFSFKRTRQCQGSIKKNYAIIHLISFSEGERSERSEMEEIR